jgi:hypothetical protein
MYNNFIGLFQEPPEDWDDIAPSNRALHKVPESDYEKVRFGLPQGVVSFEKTKHDREILIKHSIDHSWASGWPSSKIDPKFRKHVAKFRASLDLWEAMCPKRSFSKEEIYHRCLSDGPSYTEWVKKSRAACFRLATAETNTEIDPEYIFENYQGYDSLLHERYLIHWDDRKDIDDVKYSFIPVGEGNIPEFRKRLDSLWEDFRLHEVEFSQVYDALSFIKNTQMYDPTKAKSSLIRDFWTEDIRMDSPYFAKRAIVPTTPGSTRDTGVGDPSTILKVKILNYLAREISERLPYSANTTGPSANARLKRVLKKNLFLHLDFKKFGLTFPRALMNEVIRKIEETSGLDLKDLYINSFYVQIDDEVYETSRGTMLGWLDAINSIAVCAILHDLAKDLQFDFITFNDDVEISKRNVSAPGETLELLRGAVISEMNFFDIIVSLSKTYGSKASVFLERYAYYDQYGIDMYKEQLTILAYSKSLTTVYPWQAKFFHAAAEQWTKCSYATDRCIKTCAIEFRRDECSFPLWAGGWFIYRQDGLDLSYLNVDMLGLRLGAELSEFKEPRYTTPPKRMASIDQIVERINYLTWHASKGEIPQGERLSVPELNEDIENVRQGAQTLCDVYTGRNEEFPRRVLARILAGSGHAGPGPG